MHLYKLLLFQCLQLTRSGNGCLGQDLCLICRHYLSQCSYVPIGVFILVLIPNYWLGISSKSSDNLSTKLRIIGVAGVYKTFANHIILTTVRSGVDQRIDGQGCEVSGV